MINRARPGVHRTRTCKAIDVDPERYLEDVLVRVDTTPASEVHRLTPWAWAAEQAREG